MCDEITVRSTPWLCSVMVNIWCYILLVCCWCFSDHTIYHYLHVNAVEIQTFHLYLYRAPGNGGSLRAESINGESRRREETSIQRGRKVIIEAQVTHVCVYMPSMQQYPTTTLLVHNDTAFLSKVVMCSMLNTTYTVIYCACPVFIMWTEQKKGSCIIFHGATWT